MRDWFAVRKALGDVHTQIWRLPWEAKRLVASDFDKFLQQSLKRRAIAAPADFVYSGPACDTCNTGVTSWWRPQAVLFVRPKSSPCWTKG
jgi:hypothetical protein